MLGVFLLIARTARDGAPCPGDEVIADIYGTSSLGRARRVLAYMESRDVIVPREDLAGRRSIAIPRRSEAHTSELQSLMRISYAVFCLNKKKKHTTQQH